MVTHTCPRVVYGAPTGCPISYDCPSTLSWCCLYPILSLCCVYGEVSWTSGDLWYWCPCTVSPDPQTPCTGCPVSRVPHLCPSLTAGTSSPHKKPDALLDDDENEPLAAWRGSKL